MRSLAFLLGIFSAHALFAQDTLKRIDYFQTDRYTLTDTSLIKLKQDVEELRLEDIHEIRLNAYCDDRASESYNQTLAENRATAIARQYRKLWPDLLHGQIVVDEIGELALNGIDTGALRASNRRVESFIVLKPTPAEDEFSNLKVGDKVILKNLLFIGGRHFLLKESEPYLDSLVLKVKHYKQYKFRISGHICCQPKGMDGLDWDTQKRNLSVARAKMIYDYLVNNGIDPKRLEFVGHGSNFKLGGADKFDRRVEIEVIGLSEK